MATDIVPVAEYERKVYDIASFGFFRPMLEFYEARVYIGKEVCRCDIHFLMAQIVLPALEDSEGDVQTENGHNCRNVFFDKLGLKCDGVRGNDGGSAIVFGEPVKQRNQVSKGFTNASAGFREAGN
jgi:hypothetical protein